MILFVRIWAPISGVLNKRQIYSPLGLTSAATLYVRSLLIISSRDWREADSRDTSPRHACLGEISRKIWLHDFAINNKGGSVPVIFISLYEIYLLQRITVKWTCHFFAMINCVAVHYTMSRIVVHDCISFCSATSCSLFNEKY